MKPVAEHKLPPAEKTVISVGFMRLSDSAPLILAHELGLYQQMGLQVRLVREVSWANLRDRLVLGDLDAAQLLAPLPMMTGYGAGGIRANLLTGLSLSLNGNAITVSPRLWAEMAMAPSGPPDALETAIRLRKVISRSGQAPALTFATVHLFSMHTILLRMWLRAGGVDPDRDVKIIVLPPEQMCDSLARGIIDGYCVGEPWNTVAVSQGTGFVPVTGYQIWNNAPEKVLGVTESWHGRHPGTHARLRIALMQASACLVNTAQRQRAAEILALPEYLGLPVDMLLPSLTGNFRFGKNQEPVQLPDFHVFWRYQAGFPWRSHAMELVRRSAFALTREISSDQLTSLVQQSYRPDLYREAARLLNLPSPSRDHKTEALHAANWFMEEGIELGPDLMLDHEPSSPPQSKIHNVV